MRKPLRVRSRGGQSRIIHGAMSRYFPQDSPHPVPLMYHATSRQCYKNWRYIVDTHGFLEDDFNPCFHERYAAVYNFPDSISYHDTRGLTHQLAYDFKLSLKDPVVDCRNISLDGLDQWLQDFSARAENHYVTLVDQDWSLINFIIEALELMEGNVSVLERLKEGIEGAVAAYRRKFAESGNHWLSWNFAIAPTLRDLWALANTFKRAEKRLKWLRQRNHKNTKVKYREGPRVFTGTTPFTTQEVTVEHPYFVPPPEYGPKGSYPEYPDWVDLEHLCEADYSATVVLSSWAWIRFDIPDYLLSAENDTGLGIVMLTMQGLYNPLQIGWEAVPFSWLIDWFRSEAHKLREALKSDLNPLGHARILSVGWTINSTVLGTFYSFAGVTVAPDSEFGGNADEQQPRTEAGNFIYTCYNRQPGLPIIDGPPFSVPWKWYHLSILLSLVQSHKRRD